MTETPQEHVVRTYETNPDALIGASNAKVRYDVTFRTIVLTAPVGTENAVGTSIRPICVPDLSRERILVQCFTNDIVLCESQSRAQDPANAVVGLPNPEGFLVWHLNTAPIPLPSTDLIWATAASFPALISIILINKVH